jgi:pyruvate formate lyase activating enzyme
MKESYLYKKISNNQVECQTCSHYCKLAPGRRGICGVRENINGKLYALNYDKVATYHVDPIEKKPLFHFLPGTQTFSLATVGCNFRCDNCQNWDISQGPKMFREILGEKMSPKELVDLAKKSNCESISYTYTEPTIFLELALDTMKIAKEKGLKNVWVSNGFMSKKTFELASPYIDAINIDLKFFDDKLYRKITGGRLDPVLDNLKRFKKAGILLEVTTLAIPTLSDSPEIFIKIADFIFQELGADTPWHISAFSGKISWKLKHLPPTPIEVVKQGYKIGKEAGLKYVYTGNIFGDSGENTYCPKCNAIVIERCGYTIKRLDKDNKCPKCNEKIDMIF